MPQRIIFPAGPGGRAGMKQPHHAAALENVKPVRPADAWNINRRLTGETSVSIDAAQSPTPRAHGI